MCPLGKFDLSGDPNILDIAESATARVRTECPVEAGVVELPKLTRVRPVAYFAASLKSTWNSIALPSVYHFPGK